MWASLKENICCNGKNCNFSLETLCDRVQSVMPAKDVYHQPVKNALIRDGWTITDDPYFIQYEDAELYADLAAEKPIAAERQSKKIVVEIISKY
ncbi:element excision factor XisH family protein [Spirulina sp. 06S082]|nr:element excision factor XisH family protein [Spirulina sp. 06S082]MEA5468636.1 element excision factor XisH family protein [Spirulina sp. 06S082]